MSSSIPIYVQQWGRISYQEAWQRQEVLFQQLIRQKLANRRHRVAPQPPLAGYLIFCEHRPVYTLGKRTCAKHLLVPEGTLQQQGIAHYNTNRGGGITYHGPGQLVVYPILDLEPFCPDLHRYMRLLEEVVIQTIQAFGLVGSRLPYLTGVWIHTDYADRARKICALGIRTRHWITMHGLALNVNTDLAPFKQIVPCGIADKPVTSMAQELGQAQDYAKVSKAMLNRFLKLLPFVRSTM